MADIFYKAGLIESWGRGTLKIVEECIKEGLREPEFELNDNFFSVVFYRKSDVPVSEGLSEGLKTLWSAIKEHSGVQAKDLVGMLDNRPLKTIERQIAQLIRMNLIERRGSRKTGGYWPIAKDKTIQKI